MSNRRAKANTSSSGSAHVAVRGVSYLQQGAAPGDDEFRAGPGERLEKCPPDLLQEYLERGDVVPAEDAPPTPEPEAADGASEGDDDDQE